MKGHIQTVHSKHTQKNTAETKSADSQGNTKEKKNPCDITKWGSNMYTTYTTHIAQSTWRYSAALSVSAPKPNRK